jgi:uncharacterized protein YllA (UPF0747 family)
MAGNIWKLLNIWMAGKDVNLSEVNSTETMMKKTRKCHSPLKNKVPNDGTGTENDKENDSKDKTSRIPGCHQQC